MRIAFAISKGHVLQYCCPESDMQRYNLRRPIFEALVVDFEPLVSRCNGVFEPELTIVKMGNTRMTPCTFLAYRYRLLRCPRCSPI